MKYNGEEFKMAQYFNRRLGKKKNLGKDRLISVTSIPERWWNGSSLKPFPRSWTAANIFCLDISKALDTVFHVGRVHLNIKKHFFVTVWLAEHWHRLPREVVESPSFLGDICL